ncbi:fimbrillin family protein [Peribacillus loiseleuriae]|uniref:fimbrillin family protein n=1 Tax=Peribacillus loiseleuriae TaxID=1679170 RepID=UPI0037F3A1CD
MKKEIGVLMLLSAVLLSGCGSDEPVMVTQGSEEPPSKQVTTQPEQETDAKLIEASENEKVKLYAIKKAKNVIKGVTLDINGNKKTLIGKSPIQERNHRYSIPILRVTERKRP